MFAEFIHRDAPFVFRQDDRQDDMVQCRKRIVLAIINRRVIGDNHVQPAVDESLAIDVDETDTELHHVQPQHNENRLYGEVKM